MRKEVTLIIISFFFLLGIGGIFLYLAVGEIEKGLFFSPTESPIQDLFNNCSEEKIKDLWDYYFNIPSEEIKFVRYNYSEGPCQGIYIYKEEGNISYILMVSEDDSGNSLTSSIYLEIKNESMREELKNFTSAPEEEL
jgi:hypothetical protein